MDGVLSVLMTTYQLLQVMGTHMASQVSSGTHQTALLLPGLQDMPHMHPMPALLWGPTPALLATNIIHCSTVSVRSPPASTRVQDFISSSSPCLDLGLLDLGLDPGLDLRQAPGQEHGQEQGVLE